MNEQGFTLIEVLVAMIIFAVGLLGLEALGVTAARAVGQANLRSEYVTLTTHHLETTLQELRAASEGLGLVPEPFCIALREGDLLQRTFDYANPRAPVVTLSVVPVPDGFIDLANAVTMSSVVYLEDPVTGAATSAC